MKWHRKLNRKITRGLLLLLLAASAGASWAVDADTDGDGLPDSTDPDPLHSNFYTPDPAFAAGGLLMEKISKGDDGAYAMLVQPDGKIVTAGVYTNSHGLFDIAVSRLQVNGQPDPAFNNGLPLQLKSNQEAHYVPQGVIRQLDGKLMLAGYLLTRFNLTPWVLRLNPDGSADSSFGKNGLLLTNVGVGGTFIGLAQQADGKVVAAGYALRKRSDVDLTFAAVRYNTDGSLDTGFGTQGKAFLDNGALHPYATAMLLQRNGNIVVGGTYRKPRGKHGFMLARFLQDGSVDTGFGAAGIVTVSLQKYSDVLSRVAEQADGKLVAAGYSESKPASKGKFRDFALVRVNVDGSLDTGFAGGKVLQDFNAGRDEAGALWVLPSGNIVAAGGADAGQGQALGLAVFRPDGTLDTSAIPTGKQTVYYPGAKGTTIKAMQQQADGKLVMAGWAQDPASKKSMNTLVARFYAADSDGDGVPDPADAFPLDPLQQ